MLPRKRVNDSSTWPMGKKRTGDPFLCLPEELKTVCSPDTSEVLKRAMKGSPVDDPLLFFVPNPAWDQEPSNQTPGLVLVFSPPDHAFLYLRVFSDHTSVYAVIAGPNGSRQAEPGNNEVFRFKNMKEVLTVHEKIAADVPNALAPTPLLVAAGMQPRPPFASVWLIQKVLPTQFDACEYPHLFALV